MSAVEPGGTTGKSRDLLASPWSALLLFCLPAAAMIATGNSAFSNRTRTIVWTLALSAMAIACLANARRCGRVHCYLTGPFFLVMAVVTLLYGLGIAPLPRNGWNLIGLTTLVGAIVLCCLPEMFLGKYRKHPRQHGNHR